MENHDKIFDQIKNAAESSESREFPAMEKVWNRVEEKLDHKVLKKENKLWKKIAVAASLLLISTLGYQLWKPANKVTDTQNHTVATDTITTVSPSAIFPQNAVVTTPDKNPAIREDADRILQEQIISESEVAASDMVLPVAEAVISKGDLDKKDYLEKKERYDSVERKSSGMLKGRSFESVGVKREENTIAYDSDKDEVAKPAKKSEALLVVDGKAMAGKDYKAKQLEKLTADEVDDIVTLEEPLYIINGVQYSEMELFGPNPTSPYTPLNKQEIETLSILQGEKATAIYGDKGKKGVVIITTKNGKPAAKAGR